MDQVVELHREAFGEKGPRQELRDFLTEVLFRHPWLDEDLPSLAYVGKTGELMGCLGVMPRPMLLNNRPIRAVVTHDFIVAPGQRGGLASIQLMRAMIGCGPELTLADGNETSRRICEALGSKTIMSRSQRWLRVLKPTGLGVHVLERWMNGGRVASGVTRAMAGMAAAPDAILQRVPGLPSRVPSVEGGDAEPTPGELRDLLERLTSHLTLRPLYTEATLTWLMNTLKGTRSRQRLKTGVVRDSDEAIGWYVYYSRPGGVGRVLQLGAAPGAHARVLDHLFASGAREGNVGLSGQSDPAWNDAFEKASCIIRPGSSWFLMHTSNPEAERALTGPDAFLSRLEGEAWLHFRH